MRISVGLLLLLLAIVGTLMGIAYITTDSTASPVTFTYERATEREDGSALLPEQIKLTRLFCDGKWVAQEAGSDGDISAMLSSGTHDCFATHVDTNNLESKPSNSVKRFVEP